jgi:DNA-binding transcriptional regulator YiaG
MQRDTRRHIHQFISHKATVNAPFRFTWSGLPNVHLAGIRYDLCLCGMRQGFYPQPLQLIDVLTGLILGKTSRLTPSEIRYLRKSLQKNHKSFSELVGVSITQISRWENGRSAPSLPTEKLIRLIAGADGKALEPPAIASEKERYLLRFHRNKWSGSFLK